MINSSKSKLFIFCFGYFTNLIQVQVLKLLEDEFIKRGFIKGKNLTIYYGVNKNKASALLKKISEEPPTYIIGLGLYRKDGRKIRAEQKFVNKYGRSAIDVNGPEKVYSNWEINDARILAKGYCAGNGPCNLISYKILNEINKNSQKYAFFHIPSSFDPSVVKEEIVKVIRAISVYPTSDK